MSFNATLPQAKLLRELLAAVTVLTNEATLQCSPSGVQLQTMDSAHVALVEFVLFQEAFSAFECSGRVAIGLNLLALQKVLACGGEADAVSLCASANGEELRVQLASSNRASEFKIKLMNLSYEELGVPDMPAQVEAVLDSSELNNVCKNLAQLGDEVELEFTRDLIAFRVGGEAGSGCIQLRNAEDGCRLVFNGAACHGKFSVRYLAYFCRGAKLSNLVTLKYSANTPLQVHYDIMSGDAPIGVLRYFLAPKIED